MYIFKLAFLVAFNYVYGNREEYIKIPAEEIQQGVFQVKVPIKVESEPKWEVGLINNNGYTQREMSEKELEEKRIEEQTLKYFVSTSNDDLLKSGEFYQNI